MDWPDFARASAWISWRLTRPAALHGLLAANGFHLHEQKKAQEIHKIVGLSARAIYSTSFDLQKKLDDFSKPCHGVSAISIHSQLNPLQLQSVEHVQRVKKRYWVGFCKPWDDYFGCMEQAMGSLRPNSKQEPSIWSFANCQTSQGLAWVQRVHEWSFLTVVFDMMWNVITEESNSKIIKNMKVDISISQMFKPSSSACVRNVLSTGNKVRIKVPHCSKSSLREGYDCHGAASKTPSPFAKSVSAHWN